MYSLKDDYSEGAHPKILDAIINSNMIQESGYGMDSHCLRATELIKEAVNDDTVDVHYISGGTQTNLLVISSCLRPHEACISAKTGHIATHETGAIEATGHKVITVDTVDGKLSPELILPVLIENNAENTVKPKLVYISNPTELGTIYNKDELIKLYEFCKSKDLLLYLDGARLSSALVVPEAELNLEVISKYTDAFFLGGTKNGALLGEALILSHYKFKEDFRYMIKQRGAMLAKGRIMGVQFETLMTDGLYLELAKYARDLAQYTKSKLVELGIEMLVDSPTNQIFPIMSNDVIAKMRENFAFYDWEVISADMTCIRLVFSWATPKNKVEDYINTLAEILGKKI